MAFPALYENRILPALRRFAEGMGRLPAAVLAVIPLVYGGLMVIGLVRWYTPVPFWDMWDSYLASYIEYLEGGWQHLFKQTNEHRIWFSNVLFYLDLTFFGGRSVLLVPVNGLLAIANWLMLAVIARRLLRERMDLWAPLALCLAPLCFSWLQEQNLIWGFQSQFFVAYLFPLIAFAALARSYDSVHARWWFVCALIFAVASLGTMANGILALPLMLAMTLFMPGINWRRAAIIAVVGGIALSAWFQGYLFMQRDRADVVQFVTFVLTFLGLPFAAMLGSKIVGYLAGAFFVTSSSTFAFHWLRARVRLDPLVLALIAFLAYIGATSAIISLGRAAIQPNAALISRYATPSLFAWGALAILLAYAARHLRFARSGVITIGVLLALGLLPLQRQVFSDVGPYTVHSKLVAALAVKMGIRDLQSISAMYPTDTQASVDHLFVVAGLAEERKLSIMTDQPMAEAVANIGRPITDGFHACQGAVNDPEVIPGVAEYHRVMGWMLDRATGEIPSYVYLVKDGIVEGVAPTGFVRRDVAETIDERALMGGFIGFIRAGAGLSGAALQTFCAD